MNKANNFQEKHKAFVGEVTAFLEGSLYKPICIGQGNYLSDGFKGVLLKYVAIPHKDEMHELPHITYQLFLYYYKKLEEVSEKSAEELKELEATLTLPFEPYTDKIWLDKKEIQHVSKKLLVSQVDLKRDTEGSCTQCTLDFVCTIKSKIHKLFDNLPVRLYPEKITVWHDVLKTIGNKCPHFNQIIKKEAEA